MGEAIDILAGGVNVAGGGFERGVLTLTLQLVARSPLEYGVSRVHRWRLGIWLTGSSHLGICRDTGQLVGRK